MKRVLALLVLATAFPPALAQTQYYDIPKAAVQFDGVPKSANYTWNGTNLVVTTTSGWGIKGGDHVFVSFTNSALNGYYAIQSATGNALTLANTQSGSGSGTASVRVWVKAALNIASVEQRKESPAYGGSWITGYFRIYFSTPFVDERYIAVGGSQYWKIQYGAYNYPPTKYYFEVHFFQADGSRDPPDYAPFVFFGTLEGE